MKDSRLVLSPHEPLVERAAEQFERDVQAALADGRRHVVIDLSGVARIDDAAVRGLVRGYTTARRLGGSLRLVAPNADVRAFLQSARLDSVFPILESVDAAQAYEWPWRTIALIAGGLGFCALLVWAGQAAPEAGLTGAGAGAGTLPVDSGSARTPFPGGEPVLALLKLLAATGIGLLVTAVHRPSLRDRPLNRSIEQAQTLLCVAGAMVMIIIGNSIARAFGIAGAATIIRFRTPVDDPKDVTIIFLLMSLGMSTGLGAFGVAGLGTAFLCTLLLVLERLPSDQRPRTMMAELVAEGREFPTVRVESVFARHGVTFEPRDVSQGKEAAVKYHVAVDGGTSLEQLTTLLTAAGIKSVAWKNPKKNAR
jgi:anti-anti-sigma factor